MKIEDGDRPRVLEATKSAMRTADGLLDPRLLGRIAAESGVDAAIVAQRWGTGASLIADVLSDKGGIATPGWPEAGDFDDATTHSVLAALAARLTDALNGHPLTQTALSQVIASPVVRRVWSDFVREDLERWTDILADTEGPHVHIDRERAAQAVHLVAEHCYSRVTLGDLGSSISDDLIIEIAISFLEAGDSMS